MTAIIHSWGIDPDPLTKLPTTGAGHITVDLPDGKQWYTRINRGDHIPFPGGAVCWPEDEQQPRLAH